MQKTAYEVRISDWSSDVCSSDLLLTNPLPPVGDDDLIADIRDALDLKPTDWSTIKFPSDMRNPVIEAKASMELTAPPGGYGYFQRDNPLLGHVVLRQRGDLTRLRLIPETGRAPGRGRMC